MYGVETAVLTTTENDRLCNDHILEFVDNITVHTDADIFNNKTWCD